MNLFLDFDDRIGTLVPAVYNVQSHQFAKAVLAFLTTVDPKKDFNWQMKIVLSVTQANKEIHRLNKHLSDKIKQYEFAINPTAKLVRDQFVIQYDEQAQKIENLIIEKIDFTEIQKFYTEIVNQYLERVKSSGLPHYQITHSGLTHGFTKVNDQIIPVYNQAPPIFDKDYIACNCVMDTPFVQMFNNEAWLNQLLCKHGYQSILEDVRTAVRGINNPESVKQIQSAITKLVADIQTEMKDYLQSNPHQIKKCLVNDLLVCLSDNAELVFKVSQSAVQTDLLIKQFEKAYAGNNMLATLIVESPAESGGVTYTIAGYNASGTSFKRIVIDDKNDKSGKLREELSLAHPRKNEIIQRTYLLLSQNLPNDLFNVSYADACFVQCGFLYRELQSTLICHQNQVTHHNQQAGMGETISIGRLHDFLDHYLERLLNIVESINLENSPGISHQLSLHQHYAQERIERNLESGVLYRKV